MKCWQVDLTSRASAETCLSDLSSLDSGSYLRNPAAVVDASSLRLKRQIETSGLDSVVPQTHVQLSSRFPPAAGGKKSLLTLPSLPAFVKYAPTTNDTPHYSSSQDDVKVALESDTKVPFSAIAGSLPRVRNPAISTTNQLEPALHGFHNSILAGFSDWGKGTPLRAGPTHPN
ncbi:hypothetical protein FRB95_000414 [Tulasnella sp. JGI-2019a]|nr:hypothetical protein FRB95_000414 [Tulasnella sp. JGI-2019a]